MRFKLAFVAVVSFALSVGCNRAATQAAAQADPLLRIESLPPADPAKFQSVRKMQEWKNPYLIVRVDGIALLDAADSEEKHIDPDKLVDALGALPTSSWPYGKVVAVAESMPPASDEDKARLRKNRALVAGTLEKLQILINWVPST